MKKIILIILIVFVFSLILNCNDVRDTKPPNSIIIEDLGDNWYIIKLKNNYFLFYNDVYSDHANMLTKIDY